MSSDLYADGMAAIRVLHCPSMVGGNPQGLARAERELGLQSRSISLTQSKFGYVADEVLCPGTGRLPARELARWRLLWKAVRAYDIVHFNAGRSIMPQRVPRYSTRASHHASLLPQALRKAYNLYADGLELRDLPLLRGLGKGIVVTYQGSDARQGAFCRAHFDISPAGESDVHEYPPDLDAHKRSRIRKFDEYADRIYALNPDLLHVLPERAEFLPYAHIDLSEWTPRSPGPTRSRRAVVLHAPSRLGMKGTRFLVAAVERLKAEGVDFEFVLVQGVPHHELRRLLEGADLVVDQLLCGWYGGLAVEAMALGKPVICYIREGDLGFVPAEMRNAMPLINATPESVYCVLREWLTVRCEDLENVGRESRAYVEAWHDPRKIALRLKHDYEDIMAAGRGCRGRRTSTMAQG